MSTKLPQEVAKHVKKRIYKAADNADYLAMSRTNSGEFINQLMVRDNIGGVIDQYVKKDQVRHYIKDAVLNRYSKDKTEEAKPDNLPPIIKRVYGLDSEESHKEDKLALFRVTTHGHEREYVVVADGTVLKWETALRKALLFISGNPFSENAEVVHILLMLFARHRQVTPSDERHLKKALAIAKAEVFVFGEP